MQRSLLDQGRKPCGSWDREKANIASRQTREIALTMKALKYCDLFVTG
jgi:hypothetical protein